MTWCGDGLYILINSAGQVKLFWNHVTSTWLVKSTDFRIDDFKCLLNGSAWLGAFCTGESHQHTKPCCSNTHIFFCALPVIVLDIWFPNQSLCKLRHDNHVNIDSILGNKRLNLYETDREFWCKIRTYFVQYHHCYLKSDTKTIELCKAKLQIVAQW